MTLPMRASLELTPTGRRPWATPQLTAYASMTVLTQSVLGVADAMMLLQIGVSGGGTGGGGPNGNLAPSQNPTIQGSASSPTQH